MPYPYIWLGIPFRLRGIVGTVAIIYAFNTSLIGRTHPCGIYSLISY
nr:MAG TPA: hypothetical protein [Caudoviricetes sp.]